MSQVFGPLLHEASSILGSRRAPAVLRTTGLSWPSCCCESHTADSLEIQTSRGFWIAAMARSVLSLCSAGTWNALGVLLEWYCNALGAVGVLFLPFWPLEVLLKSSWGPLTGPLFQTPCVLEWYWRAIDLRRQN